GTLPRARAALTADAIATTVGASLGSTPSSAYVESTSGVSVGGRTGLTTVVVAFLFIVTLFFSPIIASISSLPAITSVEIIVDCSYMMSSLAHHGWGQFGEAFPAFAVILIMPLTFSTATGISLCFILSPLLIVVTGHGNLVHAII